MLTAPGYWLARLAFTRALALVYVVAFVAAARQFRPLLGSDGILPIPRFTGRSSFARSPSLFHLHYSDRFFAGCCWLGAGVALLALVGLVEQASLWAWMLGWALLWVLYLSIVNVGQVWYGFGWESLLVEVGFLAVFLGPSSVAPPLLVMLALRWLLVRLELGAGLVKLRGDPCWRDLTCLRYHHETQPMPNPLSWRFHHLSNGAHRVEALANHVTQLVVVFGLLAPQPVASAAAIVIIVTQGWLMLSGNFAWLNLLTLSIALSALDGRLLERVLPVERPDQLADPAWFAGLVVVVVAGLAVLSYWPVRNLLSSRQRMNASFNPLHLVNTYGAFGSVTRVRHEVVVEGTDDPHPGPDTVWQAYEFKAKPGDPMRRPPQFAPYHLRLDWMMWFVAISPSYGASWLQPFLVKLAADDPAVRRLLRSCPFADDGPTFVRARIFRYRFTTPEERRATGAWWSRTYVGELTGPISGDAQQWA